MGHIWVNFETWYYTLYV